MALGAPAARPLCYASVPMRLRALEFISCVLCGHSLTATAREQEGEEILEGELGCGACPGRFPIQRGVPRLMPASLSTEATRSAVNFGGSWERFSSLKQMYHEQFMDWIRFHSLDESFFKGKLVLDLGCGKGRHSYLASSFGATDVVSMDLSSAVDVAFQNTRELGNVHVVQADIYHLPVRLALFDYVFSIGVLHHLPDPEQGFRVGLSRVRPGGSISVWIYGRENNGWIIYLVNPLRWLTSHLRPETLHALCVPLAVLLFLVLRGAYQPLDRWLPALGRRLFYRDYLMYIARFNFDEIHHIIVDHLTAPIAFYLRREEVEAWFHRAGLSHVHMRWHNKNSWSCLAHDCRVDAAQLVHSSRIEHHAARSAGAAGQT